MKKILTLIIFLAAVSSSFSGDNYCYYPPQKDYGFYHRVKQIEIDALGRVWAVTLDYDDFNQKIKKYGIGCFENGNWKKADLNSQSNIFVDTVDVLKKIACDSIGNVYISSVRGIYKYDGNTWKLITAGDDFDENGLRTYKDMAIDSNSNLYVTTSTLHGYKLLKYNGNSFQEPIVYDSLAKPGIPYFFFNNIAMGKQNTLFGYAPYHDSIYIFKNDIFLKSFKASYKTSNDNYIFSPDPSDFLVIDTNNIWIASGCFNVDLKKNYQGSANHWNGTEWKQYTGDEMLSDTLSWMFDVNSMVMDKSGKMWIGTNGGNIILYDFQRFIKLVPELLMPSMKEKSYDYYRRTGRIYDIAVDKNNNVWFGTDGGVFRIEQGITGVDEINQSNQVNIADVVVSPNPAERKLDISFYLFKNADVKIELCDMYGISINLAENRNFSTGLNHFTYDISAFPQGAYFLMFKVNGEVQTKKIIKID